MSAPVQARATGPSRFAPVAAAGDVPPGGAITVELHGRRVAVVNHRGTFYAVDGDCSHARGPLAEGRVEGACLLACPWHGAAFDLRTGRVARGPARKPVSTYQVKVSDGVLYLSA